MSPVPFRWNLQHPEQLGSLPLKGAEDYPEFLEDVRCCAARVLAFSANSDLVFVGRSPESIFDYLQGALQGMDWQKQLFLLNLSLRRWPIEEMVKEHAEGLLALEQQFLRLGLMPHQLLTRSRPVSFVDLVCSGTTFLALYDLLLNWAARDRIPARAFKDKIRFVGLVEARPTSPNTWRWHQKARWPEGAPLLEVKNISIPYRLWTYLGDHQHKVSRWNPPFCWADENIERPPREQWHLQALGQACWVHGQARTVPEKQAFLKLLVQTPAMKESWFRKKVLELSRKHKAENKNPKP